MDARVHASIEFGRYTDPLGQERWVTIPVGVAPAVTEKKISFRLMHNCGNPVEVKKGSAKTSKTTPPKNGGTVAPVKEIRFCSACGVEVTDVVRGYEYQKDKYVTFTEEELETTKGPNTKNIRLEKFISRNEVTALMVTDHHFLIPDRILPDDYGVLYQALAESKLAGFGTHSLWQGKEHHCVVYAEQGFAAGGVLMMQSLRPVEDLVEPDFSAPVPKAQAKKATKELIMSLRDTLAADDLISAQRQRVNALVAAKLAGVEPPSFAEGPVEQATELMESLRQAIAARQTVKK